MDTNTPVDDGRAPRWRMRPAVVVTVVLALAAGGFVLLRPPGFLHRIIASRSEAPGEGRALDATSAATGWSGVEEYVGSQSCRDCHPGEFETFLATRHRRALAPVQAEQEPPDAQFDHAASGRRYRIQRQDGLLWHEESLVPESGEELRLSRYPLKYSVGSGNFGKTYLCEDDGFLIESPVTWFTPRQAWGMSPGYDHAAQQSFTRVISANCLLCHAGIIETDASSALRMRIVEESIGCERCHGPGRSHVEQQSGKATSSVSGGDSIVNPARLSRQLSEAICQQCHLQGDLPVPGRDSRPDAYRPGRLLEPYRCEFRLYRNAGEMKVVGHFEQLQQSACYRQTETLTCTTCHLPHASLPAAELPAHYRTVCLSCHEDRGCKLTIDARLAESNNDCVKCHMPPSGTEVPHIAATHHRIGVHPRPSVKPPAAYDDPLVPLSELSLLPPEDRARVMALAKTFLLFRAGPAALQSVRGQDPVVRLERELLNLPGAEADGPVAVAQAELLLLRGDLLRAGPAARAALRAAHRGSDEEARALVILASIDLREKRFEDAARSFARLGQMRRDANDWYSLGYCHEQCGRLDAAITATERARGIDPANLSFAETLAGLNHVRGSGVAEQQLREEAAKIRRWAARQQRTTP